MSGHTNLEKAHVLQLNAQDEPAPGLDPGIAITTTLLIGLGVVMSYSATVSACQKGDRYH